MTEHVTTTSWVLFFKVLSVNKLCPVQFVKCPTKKKIWKDICPLNKEKLFPALVLKLFSNNNLLLFLRLPAYMFPWVLQLPMRFYQTLGLLEWGCCVRYSQWWTLRAAHSRLSRKWKSLPPGCWRCVLFQALPDMYFNCSILFTVHLNSLPMLLLMSLGSYIIRGKGPELWSRHCRVAFLATRKREPTQYCH